MVSTGMFRGLVSIGGDNSLAIELDPVGSETGGQIRLVPLNALLAIDILEAAKAGRGEALRDSVGCPRLLPVTRRASRRACWEFRRSENETVSNPGLWLRRPKG